MLIVLLVNVFSWMVKIALGSAILRVTRADYFKMRLF